MSYGGSTVDMRGQKTRALLAYIALSENETETRERLVGLLWSEADGERARGSLRQSLREFRRAFDAVGYRGLSTDNHAVWLHPGSFEVDIWTVISWAERRKVHPMLLHTDRISEGLLDGCEDLDPSFRVWLLARRQTLHDRLLRALEDGLAHPKVDRAEKLRMAEAIIKLEPTNEEACRYAMRARAESGDLATALRIYRTLWNLLDEEYGMEPSARTQRLVAEIKNGALEPEPLPSSPTSSAAASASASPPAPDAVDPAVIAAASAVPPSRLVLSVEPFATGGVSPEQMHVVDAFRHHLIACLVKFREWQVTERRQQPEPPSDSAGPTVRYALQATVYQESDALNLILSLKDLDSEQFVWSERLRLRIENVFELQQRVVQRLTAALNVQLSTERLVRLVARPNLPREQYDRWLLGQKMVGSRNPADWEQATVIFRGLLREAPRFSPAYSSLVQLRNTWHIVHPGVFRTLATQRETLALAKTAAQIDPIDSRAQLCLGWAYTFDGQHEQALLHFGLACDLNDTDPWTLISSAHGHAFAGERERAELLAERAINVALVPNLFHWTYRAVMHFLWEEYAASLDAADRSLDVAAMTRIWRAASLYLLGRVNEARREGQRLLDYIEANWRGDPMTPARIGQWITQLFPIRAEQDRERLHRALRGAGLPIEGASHRLGERRVALR